MAPSLSGNTVQVHMHISNSTMWVFSKPITQKFLTLQSLPMGLPGHLYTKQESTEASLFKFITI